MIKNKLSNLIKYFDVKNERYSTAVNRNTFDPNDLMKYYLSQSHRANHSGPIDKNGVPLYIYRGNPEYFSAFISMYALGNLELGRKTGSEQYTDIFKNMADYFLNVQSEDGAWKIHLMREKFGIKKPWASAMSQGLVISCLARAYKLYSKDRYLESAIKALLPFHKDINQGGVSSYENDYIFFEEFPSERLSHVLNGSIFAIWGLLDLARLKKENNAQDLYKEGMKTILNYLPNYDMGYWSLYNLSKHGLNPASLAYHKLHISQLDVLYSITNNESFRQRRDLWRSYLGNRFNAFRTLPRKIIWNIRYGL